MNKIIKLLAKPVVGLLRRVRSRYRGYVNAKRLECDLKTTFAYDKNRFHAYSGAFESNTEEKLKGRIIRFYHIVEKGLTMPNRKLSFGRDVVRTLMELVNRFEERFGKEDGQVCHAASVIVSYWEMHKSIVKNSTEDGFWTNVEAFVATHSDVGPSHQPHVSRSAFYANRECSFPQFAVARHVVRHYSSMPVDIAKIRKAVAVAATAPTACNRQHCRCYCVSDKELMTKILAIQGGSRGFGHLADKLLIVTSSLEDTVDIRERCDIYTNGGLFLMQLCNALYYFEIAYCILNWTRPPSDDYALRKIIEIPPAETVISLLTIGEAPSEFDVAASPRKPVDEIFKVL